MHAMPNVKFIHAPPFILIAFTDDQSTKSIDMSEQLLTLYDVHSHLVDKAPHENPRVALDAFDVAADPFGFLIAHMAVHYGCLTYCDIGAHLGITTMNAVLQALRFGVVPKAFAFDAGQAAQVTWRNFEINGFQIEFEETAVAARNGHAIFHMEAGNSVNNRLVNGRDSQSVPVRTIRLDDYLTAKCSLGPLAVKIDTQGAEPAVIAGMAGLRHLPLSMALELTPWAIRESGKDPREFVADLLSTHHLFDMGSQREKLVRVDDPVSVILTADGGAPYWTDLLAVPRSLVEVDSVLDRLTAA